MYNRTLGRHNRELILQSIGKSPIPAKSDKLSPKKRPLIFDVRENNQQSVSLEKTKLPELAKDHPLSSNLLEVLNSAAATAAKVEGSNPILLQHSHDSPPKLAHGRNPDNAECNERGKHSLCTVISKAESSNPASTTISTVSDMTLIPDSKSLGQMALPSVVDTNLTKISEKFAPSDNHSSKQHVSGDDTNGMNTTGMYNGLSISSGNKHGPLYLFNLDFN